MSYVETFIRVADDCPVDQAQAPPPREKPSVAELQLALLTEAPYALTEEELYVRVHGRRQGLDDAEIAARYDELHAVVFAKPQACMRASPLTKRYGYGAHYDADGRIGLHPLGSEGYARLVADPGVRQLAGMRSARKG